MKIKFSINEDSIFDDYSFTFNIEEISDKEIISIAKLNSIKLNLYPGDAGISDFSYMGQYGILNGPKDYEFVLQNNEVGLINFSDLYKIRFGFKGLIDAEKFQVFITKQFENEINKIDGIKKIYEGAEKVLDKNSNEYKEIIEKNRKAWKKLADL